VAAGDGVKGIISRYVKNENFEKEDARQFSKFYFVTRVVNGDLTILFCVE
jgi:hypothetical protein